MIKNDSEFENPITHTQYNKLDKKEKIELKHKFKQKISEKKMKNADNLRLKTIMDDTLRSQYESLQTWVSNNINYLKTSVTYVGVFATDEISQSIIRTLFERLNKIEKEFNRASPKKINSTDLPFETTLLVHIRSSLLPIVGQLLPLKNEIDILTQKIFKI